MIRTEASEERQYDINQCLERSFVPELARVDTRHLFISTPFSKPTLMNICASSLPSVLICCIQQSPVLWTSWCVRAPSVPPASTCLLREKHGWSE
jgi:hypothetical protein